MKKMQLKGLNLESFVTTAKVKGGEFPNYYTLLTCDSTICTITNDRTCDIQCR